MMSDGELPAGAISDRDAGSAGERRCAWCGAPLGEPARPTAGRVRCGECGAATTDPWPSPDELQSAYARYRPESGRFALIVDAVLRYTRGRLAARIDRMAPAGSVLDVGAGDGALLDALARRSRAAKGLERHSRRTDVVESEITELDATWSAIVFWHSLEHLPEPGRAVDHAARHLCPGGLLLIAVPNTDSLQARVFGDRWFHLDLPRHLVHLPARALEERLRALGLQLTRVSHWRGGQAVFGWLHGLVGSLPGRPDLYDAIRRPDARSRPLSPPRRAGTLVAGVVLLPAAAAAVALELACRRGGTVYVEARRG